MGSLGKYDRLFSILEYLTEHPDGVSMSDIAHDVGVPLSSTHDLLRELVQIEAISGDENRVYRIGPRTRMLALSVRESTQLERVAGKYLRMLSERLGYDTYLATAEGTSITYVMRSEGSHRVRLDLSLGQPLAIHATAVGKLFAAIDERFADVVLKSRKPLRAVTPNTITDKARLRAEFERIRVQGYSVTKEEGVLGVTGFAAPIFKGQHELAGAIHVSALTTLLPEADIAVVADEAVGCAKALSEELV